MDIVLIISIIALTIMYIVGQIADVFKTKYKNVDKIIKKNKNCEIHLKDNQESK